MAYLTYVGKRYYNLSRGGNIIVPVFESDTDFNTQTKFTINDGISFDSSFLIGRTQSGGAISSLLNVGEKISINISGDYIIERPSDNTAFILSYPSSNTGRHIFTWYAYIAYDNNSLTITTPAFVIYNNKVGVATMPISTANSSKPSGFLIGNGGFTMPNSSSAGFITFTVTRGLTNSSLELRMNDSITAVYNGGSDSIPDPYNKGGSSSTGGGDGTFDGSSDPVDIPALPTVGAQDAGFISLFAPTIAQLKNLASFMWSDLFDIDTFKKIFNDPMDSILGLSVVPVTVPTSGAREITVGNIVTTVSMNVASQQYIEVDCGSVDFTSKYFGSYLDYEPYTKISIYVPYSGYHDLRADDIMGRVVQMIYHIDILTGSLVAFLKCGNSVLYEFNGACASNIPVTNISYNSTIENAMRIAVNIGTTVATAGASAPLSAGTAVRMVGSTAEGALSMKPSVGRSGSMGGTTGIMGNQIPYFIITRPRICVPTNQNHYQGYPSFITYKINSLEGKGFTVFDTVLLKDINLTDKEKDELTSILKEGVYL